MKALAVRSWAAVKRFARRVWGAFWFYGLLYMCFDDAAHGRVRRLLVDIFLVAIIVALWVLLGVLVHMLRELSADEPGCQACATLRASQDPDKARHRTQDRGGKPVE